jgi:hypothetical protein
MGSDINGKGVCPNLGSVREMKSVERVERGPRVGVTQSSNVTDGAGCIALVRWLDAIDGTARSSILFSTPGFHVVSFSEEPIGVPLGDSQE